MMAENMGKVHLMIAEMRQDYTEKISELHRKLSRFESKQHLQQVLLLPPDKSFPEMHSMQRESKFRREKSGESKRKAQSPASTQLKETLQKLSIGDPLTTKTMQLDTTLHKLLPMTTVRQIAAPKMSLGAKP